MPLARTTSVPLPISELVPAILDRFLETDREFQRTWNERRDA